MSLFIAKINELDENDLIMATRLPSSERLLLITDNDGRMPCAYFSYLKELHMMLDFFQVDEPADEFDEGLFIGMMVAGYRGDVNLIFKKEYEKYKKFDGNRYEGNGQIKIHVYKAMDEIESMPCTTPTTLPSDEAKLCNNTKEPEMSYGIEEIPDFSLNDEVAFSDETIFGGNDEEMFSDDELGLTDIEQTETNDESMFEVVPEDGIPAEFKMALHRIDEENIGIADDAEKIAKAILASNASAVSTLKFQLQMRFSNEGEKVEPYYDLLCGEFSILRRMLCE